MNCVISGIVLGAPEAGFETFDHLARNFMYARASQGPREDADLAGEKKIYFFFGNLRQGLPLK